MYFSVVKIQQGLINLPNSYKKKFLIYKNDKRPMFIINNNN
jgi:hypothetical protein